MKGHIDNLKKYMEQIKKIEGYDQDQIEKLRKQIIDAEGSVKKTSENLVDNAINFISNKN